MEIIFLGTGPARPILERPRRSRREQSAAVIREKGRTLLIDAGPAIRKLLAKEGVAFPSLILLTHRHSDAAGGLEALAAIRNYSPALWFSAKELKHFACLAARGWKIKHWQAHKPFLHHPLKVVAFPVLHALRPEYSTWGFHIQAGGKRVTYASDFKSIPLSSRKYFRGNDLLIADGAGWKHDLPTHRGILNHVLAYAAANRRVLFTQIGRAVPPHEQANRALRKICPRAALAYDGLRVKL